MRKEQLDLRIKNAQVLYNTENKLDEYRPILNSIYSIISEENTISAMRAGKHRKGFPKHGNDRKNS